MRYNEIERIEFKSVGDILDTLIRASKLPHTEYESVKLYGSSSLMIDVLKCALCKKKYSDITIASIDMTMPDIDPVLKDDYVLVITDDKELYVQSVWNDDVLFSNDAKFAICYSDVSPIIIDNVLLTNTPVAIGNLK